MNQLQIVILIPVYNDWESLNRLLCGIDSSLSRDDIFTSILIVNDSSTIEQTFNYEEYNTFKSIEEIEILNLNCNLGHQRAIATGLADIHSRKNYDAVIVMDSDGEDMPSDLPKLLDKFCGHPDHIIVAKRKRRSEGCLFKLGYFIYKILFRMLTGESIAFGNFCLIPSKYLQRLVYHDSLWNHLPASILRSRLPVKMISTNRGNRYEGKPKMRTGALVLLGLSAVSVYSDVALLRTLAASLIMSIITLFGIAVVTTIRFFTDLAIPGWASNVVGSLAIIFIQCLVITVFILFIILSNRSQRTFIPAKHYSDFVHDLGNVFKR